MLLEIQKRNLLSKQNIPNYKDYRNFIIFVGKRKFRQTMAIENPFLDKVSRSFSVELPKLDTMDAYLDHIIPLIKDWGEDLREEEFYLDTRWLEIRDTDDFHESVLHIFRDEEEYLLSTDGNISKGVWRRLPKSNTLIIEQVEDERIVKSELFDLAFMNKDFFILKKHGDQKRINKNKYHVMGRERHVKGLEWRDVMEPMFNLYRSNSQFIVIVGVALFVVAVIIVFSLL